MNYREPLTKNEIREHAAHYENSNPAVYCGTYAKYNNGSLYGMWIDLSTFENYHDFIEFCNRLHANEAEPELMFQDYEHFPEQWYCEGCMGESTFDKIKEYAALSEERREAYEAYLSYWDEGTLEDVEERYEGKYNSPEDFAEYLCEECGYFKNLPQWLQCCIDYSAVWRNLDTGGDYTEVRWAHLPELSRGSVSCSLTLFSQQFYSKCMTKIGKIAFSCKIICVIQK